MGSLPGREPLRAECPRSQGRTPCRPRRRRSEYAMTPRLNGKVALITGAASGIGLATAGWFCRDGAAVVLADNQAGRAEEEAARLRAAGHRAVAAAVDVTQSDQVRAAVAATVREFGRLDVLFANAGIGYTGDLVSTTDEDWDRVMGVTAKGVFFSCRE